MSWTTAQRLYHLSICIGDAIRLLDDDREQAVGILEDVRRSISKIGIQLDAATQEKEDDRRLRLDE